MKDRKPLPPQNKLANVCDSLADDVADGHIEADKKTSERAARIVRRAVEQPHNQDSAAKDCPNPEWKKRTERKQSKSNAGSQER